MLGASPDVAHHLQTVCLHLVHSQGWREGCLLHLLERLTVLDHLAAQVQLDSAIRLDAIGRKQELLDLVAWVYSRAQEPNPLQVHRAALYTALVPQQTPREEDRQAQQAQQTVAMGRMDTRGGSVA